MMIEMRQRPVGEPLLAPRVATGRERRGAAGLLTVGVAWLVYTRLYFLLHPQHLTFDPSLFMYLTGKPDPSCGLTRTFAQMWRLDLGHAVAVYPLGPLLFGTSFLVVAYAAWVVVTGRVATLKLAPAARRAVVVAVVVAFSLNWISKLLWLGM
jgi:hypothetical protein